MSGVFRTIGRISGIAATVATLAGNPVLAAAFAANSALMGVAASATTKKPPIQGSTSETTIGADQPRPYMIGDSYSGGAAVHETGYGPEINKVKNPYLARAVVYSAGGPIAGIDQYLADFEPVTFSGSAATGYFSEIMFQQTSLGPLLQSTALTGPWGAIPQWGSTAKLSGLAHVLHSLKWDSKNGKYTAGAPQLGIRGRGVLTWDPRADSTWPGGSGAQRWASPKDRAGFDAARATWVYTNRPGLHALRYALGTWERDLNNPTSNYVLTFGIGMTVDQIVIEDFVALENVCAANGWTINGTIYEGLEVNKWDNLKRILEAGAAQPCWKGGRLGLKITAPRVSLHTILRSELSGADLKAQGGQPWSEAINAVIPKYTSPDHKWSLQSSTKIVDAALVTIDGEEKPEEIPFELVTNPTQGAQLAAYTMYERREFGPIDVPMLPGLRGYRAGDRLTLEQAIVDQLGIPHGEVVVIQRTFDLATMTGTLTVMGDTADKHTKALAATGAAPPAIYIPTSADYDGVLVPIRAAYELRDQTVSYPISSDDTSVSIAAMLGTLDDGTTITLPAGRRSGLASDSEFAVFWDFQAAASATPASYDLTTSTSALPTGVTQTRASVATYVNSAKALTSAAVDAPRPDFDAATGAFRGWLVEPTRTNVLLASQDLTQASWAKTQATTPAANRVMENTAAAGVSHYVSQTISFTAGDTHTLSAIASEVSGSAKRYAILYLGAASVFGVTAFAKFDLATGTIIYMASNTTATIRDMGGGEWLISATATVQTSGSTGPRLQLSDQTGSALVYAIAGNGSASLRFRDAQMEKGANHSTRIVTTTAAVTRAADAMVVDFGAKNVPDGVTTITYTFDDLTTQTRDATISAGKFTVPTDLNRTRHRKIEAPIAGAAYVVTPIVNRPTFISSSRYLSLGKIKTSSGGTYSPDPTPPGGWQGNSSGGNATQ